MAAPTGRAANPTAWNPNACSVPNTGSDFGKNSCANTSPVTVLYRKKSYHSMVVPTVLAITARLSCLRSSGSDDKVVTPSAVDMGYSPARVQATGQAANSASPPTAHGREPSAASVGRPDLSRQFDCRPGISKYNRRFAHDAPGRHRCVTDPQFLQRRRLVGAGNEPQAGACRVEPSKGKRRPGHPLVGNADSDAAVVGREEWVARQPLGRTAVGVT